MADTGFLDELGLPSTDPQAIRAAQRQSALSRANQQGAAFGQQAAGLLGGLGAGVAGLVTGRNEGRGLKGFARNFGEAATAINDFQNAQALGMNREDFQSAKRIKDAAARQDFGPEGEIDTRIKLAEFVAKQAMNEGNFQVRKNALAQLDALRREKAEFDKLKATEKRAQDKSIFDNVQDIFINGESTPVTAQRRIDSNGDVVYDYVRNGEERTARPGEFSFEGPDSGGDNETLDQRWRRIVNSKARNDLRQAIITAADAIPQYRRVMSSVLDLSEQGGAEIVLSDSGTVVSFIDKAVRNIRGLGSAILSAGNSKDNNALRGRMLDRAKNAADSIWDIDLPEDFKRAAAASDQFRAQIMELAYLAARMSEPSNRGLSDNDVKNALRRLAVDSSNPQTILRRFAEIMADGASSIENQVSAVTTLFGPEHQTELEWLAGGETLQRYRKNLTDLYDDFGITIDPQTNRATFAESIDADVQPGEGVGADTVDPTTLSDEEFLETL